jgi:hypothetical protein
MRCELLAEIARGPRGRLAGDRVRASSYFAAQANIFRAEHDTHASPAKMLNDSIMRNSTAEH